VVQKQEHKTINFGGQ